MTEEMSIKKREAIMKMAQELLDLIDEGDGFSIFLHVAWTDDKVVESIENVRGKEADIFQSMLSLAEEYEDKPEERCISRNLITNFFNYKMSEMIKNQPKEGDKPVIDLNSRGDA